MHNEGHRDDRGLPRGPRRGRCVMLYRPPRLIDHRHDAPVVNGVAADLLKDLGPDTLTSTTRLNLLLFELFNFAFTFGSRAPSTPFTSIPYNADPLQTYRVHHCFCFPIFPYKRSVLGYNQYSIQLAAFELHTGTPSTSTQHTPSQTS